MNNERCIDLKAPPAFSIPVSVGDKVNERPSCIGPHLPLPTLPAVSPRLPADDINRIIARSREAIARIPADLLLPSAPGVSLPPTANNAPAPPPCEREEDPLEKFEREEAEKNASKLPAIEDSNAFLGRPIERPPVLIDGLLKKKRIMMIGASSKIGKSWASIDLSVSVASGEPWLGCTTKKGKVLYVNFELPEDEMQERIQQVKTMRCITLEAGQLDVWNLQEHAAPYNIILPAVYERVKTKQYDVIVFDPIYSMYGNLDENSAGDVAELMNKLRTLAVKSKAAVIFIHHYSKGNQAGKDSQDRASGSGVFGRAVDTNLSFTAHQAEDAYTVEARTRGFKRLEPFVIKWEYPLMVRDCSLNPKKLKTSIMKAPTFTVDALLSAAVQEPVTTSELQTKVIAASEMSESTFNRLLREFKKHEGVSQNHDKKWVYNPPPVARLT